MTTFFLLYKLFDWKQASSQKQENFQNSIRLWADFTDNYDFYQPPQISFPLTYVGIYLYTNVHTYVCMYVLRKIRMYVCTCVYHSKTVCWNSCWVVNDTKLLFTSCDFNYFLRAANKLIGHIKILLFSSTTVSVCV